MGQNFRVLLRFGEKLCTCCSRILWMARNFQIKRMERGWLSSKETSTDEDRVQITVLQWNILSQVWSLLRTSRLDLFENFRRLVSTGILWRHQKQLCPGLTGSHCFYRWTHITTHPHEKPPQEIQRHEPDIICLEEVWNLLILVRSLNILIQPGWLCFRTQVDCFSQLWTHLSAEGFSGTWVPKPSSPCLKFKVEFVHDGDFRWSFYNWLMQPLLAWQGRMKWEFCVFYQPSRKSFHYQDNMGPDGNAVFFKRSRFNRSQIHQPICC